MIPGSFSNIFREPNSPRTGRLLKKVQVQGARVLRNEAYEQYAAVTKGEAERRRWAFFSGLPLPSRRGR